MENQSEIYRSIPKMDTILENLPRHYALKLDVRYIKRIVDEVLIKLRFEIASGNILKVVFEDVMRKIETDLDVFLDYSLKPVINATGIVLHTNLGRAVLPEETIEHLKSVLCGYNTLEYNQVLGIRGDRYQHIEKLLCSITGAEAAIVVNNNAAAVMLILNTFAQNKEVIVSRGELVEIGGSFRIPDVMKASNCILREVGTTNKTHLKDYEEAIQSDTGMLLKVHTSNYKVIGFTSEVSSEALSKLASDFSLPFYEDLGSGSFIDLSTFDISQEPMIHQSIQSGVDIVSFSGDKLLGAAQSGIIVGKKKYIDALKQNQLLRALRIDKLSLTALEHILHLYLNDKTAIKKIPTLEMILNSQEAIREKATLFVETYRNRLETSGFNFSIEPTNNEIGGGALPLEILSSFALVYRGKLNINTLQTCLRTYKIPIITVIEKNSLTLDFRTIFTSDFENLIKGIEVATLGAKND